MLVRTNRLKEIVNFIPSKQSTHHIWAKHIFVIEPHTIVQHTMRARTHTHSRQPMANNKNGAEVLSKYTRKFSCSWRTHNDLLNTITHDQTCACARGCVTSRNTSRLENRMSRHVGRGGHGVRYLCARRRTDQKQTVVLVPVVSAHCTIS